MSTVDATGAGSIRSRSSLSKETIAAVVLAAGSSTRMGQNKLLLTLDGETVLRRALRAAAEAGLDPVVVVLGADAARMRAEIADLPCTAVVNADHAQGKGTSLQTGIARVSSVAEVGAAIVMLADMPFVTADMLAAVAARHRATRSPMVVSRYGQVNAPPMLYARALFAELLALPGKACGKEMIRRHRHEADVLTWDEAALVDIDAPEDYRRVRAQLAKSAAGAATRSDTASGAPAESAMEPPPTEKI
jgi:molybdenum cofactor cytidylyltransferase